MSGWGLFWFVVVTAAIVSYFGLAIVLSIGGFFDVKKMFRRLAAQESAASSASSGTTSAGAGGGGPASCDPRS